MVAIAENGSYLPLSRIDFSLCSKVKICGDALLFETEGFDVSSEDAVDNLICDCVD